MHPLDVKLRSEKRPVGAGVGLAFKSRYFMMSPGKPLHTRRGGGRVVRGGDACVAPAGGGGRHTRELDEGDANVPTPHAHRSHSYGTTPIGVNFSLSSRATARDRPCPIRRIGLASPCIVGAIPCGRPRLDVWNYSEAAGGCIVGAIPCGRPRAPT